MSATDDLLRNAGEYAASFAKGDLPLPPKRSAFSRPVDAGGMFSGGSQT
ncbi:MAG TPA: hypothetical protein VFC30_04490 [Solirubrobacteraceae bacterium]|nr:hypothetical protein [Solirubrobacteraceae bacterium]